MSATILAARLADAQNIRSALAGISPTEAAAVVGVTPSTLGLMLRGRMPFTTDQLHAIEAATGFPAAWLITPHEDAA